MMRFEDKAYKEADTRQAEQEAAIDRVFEQADAKLKKEAIDPHSFKKVYTKEVVDRDLAHVEKIQKIQAQRDKKEGKEFRTRAARVTEVIIGDGIGLYNWMGGNAQFIVPAPYDDIENNIDGLVEVEEGEGQASYLGLAMDVTFKSDVGEKLAAIEEAIRSAQPFEMKYFHSEILDIHGTFNNIPRVIFAVEIETSAELATLWATKNSAGLAKHFAQYQLFDQFIAQCETFGKLAAAAGRPKLAARYNHAHDLLLAMRTERLKEVPDTGKRDIASDRLHTALDTLYSPLWADVKKAA